MTTLTEGARAAHDEWVDQNPLRKWRLAHDPKLSLAAVAGRLGVGMSMMQSYERGVYRPGPKSGPEVEKLLGSDWPDQWDAWLAARPDRSS